MSEQSTMTRRTFASLAAGVAGTALTMGSIAYADEGAEKAPGNDAPCR